jgi:hypothetical protein
MTENKNNSSSKNVKIEPSISNNKSAKHLPVTLPPETRTIKKDDSK